MTVLFNNLCQIVYVFASKHRKYKLFPLINRRVVAGLPRLSKSLCVQSLCAFHVLPFLVFLEKGTENHQKNKDLLSLPNPKIPGKEGKNAQKNQGNPRRKKNKEFQKKQGKEGQGFSCPSRGSRRLHQAGCSSREDVGEQVFAAWCQPRARLDGGSQRAQSTIDVFVL